MTADKTKKNDVVTEKRQIKIPAIVIAILLVLLLRLILFGNLFAWSGYKSLLESSTIGDFQYSIIKLEQDYIFNSAGDSHTKYLAVGSSQTGAVYWLYSGSNTELKILGTPGMGPDLFMLYREYIEAAGPETILLYLSEFDMAIKRDVAAMKYSPFQGSYSLELAKKVWQYKTDEADRDTLLDKFCGDIFPEYKFSFIFIGMLKKLFKQEMMVGEKKQSEMTDEDWEKVHLKSLMGRNADEIAYNSAFLEDFLDFCHEKKYRVVIVEGQYNPKAYSRKNISLNRFVAGGLQRLADRYENVAFIGRKLQRKLRAEDYMDGYHVKDTIGHDYAASIIRMIEAPGFWENPRERSVYER